MNNNILKLSIISLGLTLGITLSPLAHAEDCHTPLYQSLLKIKDPNVLARTSELDLTPAQNKQFKVMQSENDKINATMNTQLTAVMAGINTEISLLGHSSTAGQTSVDKLISTSNTVIAEAQSQTAVIRHNLYNILDEKQKVKYTQLQHQEHQYSLMFLQCHQIVTDSTGKTNPDPLTHINELNLSPEQKETIIPFAKSVHDQTLKLLLQLDYSTMSVDRMENEIVQSSSPIDPTKLNKFVQHQVNVYGEIQKQRFMAYRTIYTSLNEQQKAQFMEILKKEWLKQ
ncbi:MAG: Spy/CpxP family protein refolding chaperone [Legionellaceae bacterium]|nr:Spy/CpxP family protein refolding chaperone [Legionellaceae bacterium]MBP9776112.1 Spy/CpxP family protein refolding chaperone [Legionellaceae bacterium]